MKKLLQIEAPHFTAGLEIDDETSLVGKHLAPILHYMRGWSYIAVQKYCDRKGWRWDVVTMTKFCSLCKERDHNTVDCPRLKTISHGEPRVATRQIIAPEHVSRPRRPMIPASPPPRAPAPPPVSPPATSAAAASPASAPAPISSDQKQTPQTRSTGKPTSHEPATSALPPVSPIVTATAKLLNKELPNTVTQKKRGPKKSGNALTPAEKQRNYRERKRLAAARQSKAGKAGQTP